MQIRGYAQGTTFSIQYIDPSYKNYQESIDSIMKAVDFSMSSWVDSSIVSRINNGAAGVYPIDSIFREVFLLSKKVSMETHGAFDISMAPVIYEWGIGFSNPKKLSKQVVDSLMHFVGYDQFELKDLKLSKKIPQAKLDFNAIAQGYSVDLVADFLESKGIENYMVEIGGEVKGKGKNPKGEFWRVGIDKPIEGNTNRDLEAIVQLKNQALATSGNYRKFYEVDGIKYPHTIDPSTGFPVQHKLLSATVIADDAATADAFATALMVMGTEEGKKFVEQHPEIEVFLVSSGNDSAFSTFISDGLKEELQLLQDETEFQRTPQ